MNRLLLPVTIVVFVVCLLFALDSRHGRPADAEPFVRSAGFRATGAYESMVWYNNQRAFPTGTIPADWREKAAEQLALAALRKTAGADALVSWSPVGPSNIGGRIRSIAVHPTNASIIYCGSVSGGIWKSTDSGGSWNPVNDLMPNLVISALEIDPTNANVMYAGTGEGFFNIDALRGVGVLRSTDGGSTWVTPTSMTGSPAGFPYYINDLYILPTNTSIIYAATNSGLFRTTNSGSTWTYLKRGDLTYRATQIVADPGTPATFYVAFGNFTRDGIYKTTNGGTTSTPTFTKLAGGFPTSGFNRISMAIAKTNSQVLYAVLTDSASYGTYAVVKTTNGGANWSAVSMPMDQSGSSHLGTQGWYNNVVAVSPSNESVVYAGGINAFKSLNGGTTWSQITSGYSPFIHPYMHVDQHAMAFDPNNASVMYFGNDGGMYKSTDGGTSFISANSGLAVTQFYSGAAHPSQEIYYGGTQDNGTLKGAGSPAWSTVLSGDGGFTHVDPTTPTTVFTEYTFLAIQRSTNSGSTWTRSITGIPASGSSQGDGSSDRCNFIAPFVLDPANSQNLVAGTYKVYRSTNNGVNWTSVSNDLTGSGAGSTASLGAVISALATTGDTIVAGTSGYDTLTSAPKVWVTTNKGVNWTDVTKSPLPKRYVTSFAMNASDTRRIFVGYSGYNANSSLPGHIFSTTNRGTTWANISGDLPDIPVNAIVLDPGAPLHMAVGTDLGVFETANGGTNWTQQNAGLANVSVADLDIRPDGFLVATTHGRGMYKSAAAWTTTAVTEIPSEVPQEFTLRQNYPNPFNPTTTVAFAVPSAAHVRLTVYDALGREVATLVDQDLSPGSYAAPFNASALSSGVYFYRLSAAREGMAAYSSEAKKMLLLR
jgi:photosystem II stability/assembly factor-like uncharacterized protein